MTDTFDPVPFVQRQLDAYNARDLDRFVHEYTDDVTAWRLPDAQPACWPRRWTWPRSTR